MKIRAPGINTNLCAFLATALLLLGCASPDDPNAMGKSKKGKEAAMIMFHIETPSDGTPYTQTVEVPRGSAKTMNVETAPFLDTGHLVEAMLVQTDKFGGFALRLQFNQHGAFALDTYTSANRGRHLAIFCMFGAERWVAAPLITRRISNGLLQFTPDLTREEAEYVVTGLNNVAARLKKRSLIK